MESVIDLHHASVYQQMNLVLDNVSLKVKSGEFVYLIGKVGTGKTSLLKTLYAELPLRDGQGYITGFDLKNIRQRDIPNLRRKIGMVFQDFQLLDDRSVYQNLAFVLGATEIGKTGNPLKGGLQKFSTMSICITRMINTLTSFPAENSSVWSSHGLC
jgi:ABC-type ATPase involved in cell division